MATPSSSECSILNFEKIFEVGIDAFGLRQAGEYQRKLEERLNILADYSRHYPAVNRIFDGARMSVFGAHAIYYQIQSDRILILRILGKQNTEDALRE